MRSRLHHDGRWMFPISNQQADGVSSWPINSISCNSTPTPTSAYSTDGEAAIAHQHIVAKFQSLNDLIVVSIWQMSPFSEKFAFVSCLPNLLLPPNVVTCLKQSSQIKEMFQPMFPDHIGAKSEIKFTTAATIKFSSWPTV